MAKLKITLKKSVIGVNEKVRANVQSLGLSKIRQSVIHEDTLAIRGKIKKAEHLLSVEELT
ncbi:MAG: 50S ribosomal protein L30 [Clostridia bacterium]|jgi:large subunit ribosomal protein L30|nr:50S ribosomal protein L30 [Clostridia bacterium]MDD4145725.1 50S ribosomal protein L30 [Clostridia bacterium]MDD4665291.1 50S ribosomal protein L30 [Clostridia bacterium]